MKTKTYLTVLLVVFINQVFCQEKGNIFYTKKMPDDKPLNWKPIDRIKYTDHNLPDGEIFYDTEPVEFLTSNRPCIGCNPLDPALTIFKGKNFEANNLSDTTPADNYLAISDSGKIISVDNYSIQEYSINGILETISPWTSFFTDTSLIYNKFFDPKVIYDKYSDRFILVILYKNPNDSSDSRILLAFSNQLSSAAVTWNFSQIYINTQYSNTSSIKYWFDYPNIAINKDELFITSNVYTHTSSSPGDYYQSIIFELDKNSGYTNLNSMAVKKYPNILDAGGLSASSILPFTDGLQDINYDNKMYFVSRKFSLTQSLNKVYWYRLDGDINTVGTNNITKYTLNCSVSNITAPYANQLGSAIEDRIQINDTRIASGYHKNGKLHFVYERSDQGWSEIAYMKINTAGTSTTITPLTYGGYEFQKNYMYPSITCMSNDGEKSILTYALTGPTIYNEIWAVDNQNSNWGNPISIKKGINILDLKTYNPNATIPSSTYERIGDYTNIQRKYNSETAWLVGSYPFGSTPNIHNEVDGLNAWISEVSLSPITTSNRQNTFFIYPNPNSTNLINININTEIKEYNYELIIKDITGNQVFKKQLFDIENKNIEIPSLKKGIYFISVNSKTFSYDSQKLFIN